jgi:L-lactate dehydrogenase
MRLAEFCNANNMECKLRGLCRPEDPACELRELDEIFKSTRDAAYSIIQRKGATYYAIASSLVRIVEAILRDQSTVLCVSSLINNYYDIQDVCLSLPSVLDRGGLERVLQLKLEDKEISGLQNSAKILREAITSLGLDKI